jgi:hypothetical protein
MINISQMKAIKLFFMFSIAVSLIIFGSSCSKDDIDNSNIYLGSVTTADVTEITSTSAECGGTITNWGNSGNYTSGICWSPIMGAESISGNHTTTTKESTFEAVMTELTPNTTYYVKAYFTNEAGTVYGDEKSFTTIAVDSNLVRTWKITSDGNEAPCGIAISQEGYVYISKLFSCNISKFTSEGTFITSWGSLGAGDAQFNFLKQIAVDGNNNVFACDQHNHRVQKFTSSGDYVTQWGNPVPVLGNGAWGAGTIAVDAANGWVYTVDQYNRLQKFDLSGNYITQWGETGNGNGQLMLSNQDNPVNQGAEGQMAVDAEGNVYVVDNMNFRVQKFTSSGTYLAKWGSQGNGEGQFNYHQGIAIDTVNGFIYVADNSSNTNASNNIARIQKFDLSGNFLEQLTYNNQSFATLAVNSAGNVLAISGNSVFEYNF